MTTAKATQLTDVTTAEAARLVNVTTDNGKLSVCVFLTRVFLVFTVLLALLLINMGAHRGGNHRRHQSVRGKMRYTHPNLRLRTLTFRRYSTDRRNKTASNAGRTHYHCHVRRSGTQGLNGNMTPGRRSRSANSRNGRDKRRRLH